MDLIEQLNLVRQRKHEEYMKLVYKEEERQRILLQEKQKEKELSKKVEILLKFSKKYRPLIAPNKYEKSTKSIQRFVRRNYFTPCINEEEIKSIPVMYRFRINITHQHLKEYSEDDIAPSAVEAYRQMYILAHAFDNKDVIFRYCFDIRNLYQIKNHIIEILEGYYFMQPEDLRRIESLWAKVNGETHRSIIYINQIEYYKSLSIDIYKTKNDNDLREFMAKLLSTP